MTTETKPIIDLSEWEEITERQYNNQWIRHRALIDIGDSPIRYFQRKPKPPPLVKSLEEKIKTFLRSCCAFSEGQANDLLDIARIIEEHYSSKGDK